MTKAQSSTATHYALLIGICFTPKERRGEWPPLKGCVRDVREVEKRLPKSSSGTNVRAFTASMSDADDSCPSEDKEHLATHHNIISSLESITAQAPTGSFVYIHFTGHATSVEPKSPFTNEHTGELALVVIASNDVTKIEYLHGSQLAYWLKKMVEKGFKVTLVLDCCASGSIVRSKLTPSARYLPYDLEVDMAHPPTVEQKLSLEDEAMCPVFRGASMLSNWLVNPNGYTVLTACGSAEVADEIIVEGHYRGALSYCLARIFDRLGRVGGKLQHIHAALYSRFRANGVKHSPMLYGNKNLHFFEDADHEDNSITVSIVKWHGKLRLKAGEAHGVFTGDKFALRTNGSAQRNPTKDRGPALVEVIRAGALVSDLELLDTESVPFTSGITAVPHTRESLKRFPVCLDLGPPDQWDLAVQNRPSLDIRRKGSEAPGIPFSFYVTIHINDSYEIRDESNEIIPALPHIDGLHEDPGYVLDIVEHLARYKLVESITNSAEAVNINSKKPFLESFSIHLRDQYGKVFRPGCSDAGLFQPPCSHAKCIVEVNDGDILRLVVENRANCRSLYLHAYNMGYFWEIENLLVAEYEEIPPRSSNRHPTDFEKGTSGQFEQKITMTVPKEIKDIGKQECDDIVKVFLTACPTSFALL